MKIFALLKRLLCRMLGHGPCNEGRQGNQTGRFCLACEAFIPDDQDTPPPTSPPEKPNRSDPH